MVYLIHFDKKLKHAGHYIGYTKDIEERLLRHKAGNGSCLLNALNKAGIDYHIVRTWKGGYELEKKLKSRKNSAKLCPICNKNSWKMNAKHYSSEDCLQSVFGA